VTFDPEQPRDEQGRWSAGDFGAAPETTGLNAPKVNWSAPDNYDRKVLTTSRSILKEWGQTAESARGPADPHAGVQYKDAAKNPRAYRALVPLSELDGYRTADMIASKGFTRGGAYPPIKLELSPQGKPFVIDGTHRMLYWKQQGFTHAPAWVIDYRKRSASVASSRRIKKL
jgi:hypothetical protein